MRTSQPNKALYVHHGGGAGGAANSLLFLLINLDPQRFAPTVACDFRTAESRKFFQRNGIDPVNLRIAPFAHTSRSWQLTTARGLAKFARWVLLDQPASRRAFRRLLREVRPDLVHLNGLSILPLAPVAAALDIPVVQHVRESINEGAFGVRKAWLRRLAGKYASHMIFICHDGRQRMGDLAAPASVVYNPIDFSKFRRFDGGPIREQLEIPAGWTALFFPGGSMLDIKGIEPFIGALARVRTAHPRTCAIVPSLDAPAHPRDRIRHRVEREIRDNSLQDCILRVPFSNNVERYYAASDIVVAPFVSPHFSRAVIEAGAMAKPVIGSRIGGITEVLEDGEVGLLATPGDAEDLASKICALIEQPEMAAAMGKAGNARARKHFDAAHHADAVMDIYRLILDRARNAR